ncbi:MAG TPA: hypothetical protein VEY30_07160, partial [Myxococcaceae bacterium]|nr:hypothetical protein [Myxococcaceae bacterium]
MRQRLAWVFLYCVGIACSDNSGGGTPDGGPKLDAGVDPSELYSVVTLDGTEDQRQAISLAVGPNDRVG